MNPETGKHLVMNVNVGDRVLLPEFGGMKIELEGSEEEQFLFREGEVRTEEGAVGCCC